MQLSWIYFSTEGQYVADLAGPEGFVRSLRADSLCELRSTVLSLIQDLDDWNMADDLFTEFMEGQIRSTIIKLDKMRGMLQGIAA